MTGRRIWQPRSRREEKHRQKKAASQALDHLFTALDSPKARSTPVHRRPAMSARSENQFAARNVQESVASSPPPQKARYPAPQYCSIRSLIPLSSHKRPSSLPASPPPESPPSSLPSISLPSEPESVAVSDPSVNLATPNSSSSSSFEHTAAERKKERSGGMIDSSE